MASKASAAQPDDLLHKAKQAIRERQLVIGIRP